MVAIGVVCNIFEKGSHEHSKVRRLTSEWTEVYIGVSLLDSCGWLLNTDKQWSNQEKLGHERRVHTPQFEHCPGLQELWSHMEAIHFQLNYKWFLLSAENRNFKTKIKPVDFLFVLFSPVESMRQTRSSFHFTPGFWNENFSLYYTYLLTTF